MMKKGSALLIVLGMLSFMVVSAVGFSMYMRQSRLPSSYLRRNVASRYLVKAALANAIEELEGGFMTCRDIGELDDEEDDGDGRFFGLLDNPYPGCILGKNVNLEDLNKIQGGGRKVSKLSADAQDGPSYSYCKNGDYWFNRVFCPFGPLPAPRTENDAADWAAPTVPTLTLEALAYLPPALVDDVRQASRVTRTAQWRSLPNESGRYAYTAVNVSDLFDINRLRASHPRDSGANRITLTTLTSSSPGNPLDFDTQRAEKLDELLDKPKSSKIGGQVVPYVSMADFAVMAAGSTYSPFSTFVGSENSYILQNGVPEVANALFVTDTLFQTGKGSATNTPGGVVYNLRGRHQPFKDGTFGATGAAGNFMAVLDQANQQDNAGEIFWKNLGLGFACLYDYLDRDSKPISLCIPTTEAVPMVVGVSAPAGLAVTVGNIDTQSGQWTIEGKVLAPGAETAVDGKAEVNRTCKKYGITSFGQGQVTILTTYPFKRMVASQRRPSSGWKVRGLMRLYLAQSGMRSRLADNAKLGPLSSGGSPHWKDLDKSVGNGFATFVSEEATLSEFSDDVKTMDEAVGTPLALTFSGLNVQMPLYWTVEEKYGTITPAGAFTPNNGDDAPRAAFNSLGDLANDANAMRPLDVDGNFHQGWTTAASGPWNLNAKGEDGAKDLAGLPIATSEEKFRLQMAVWIQVLDGDGDVVDMVPACFNDDVAWVDAGLQQYQSNEVDLRCGAGVPLLNFEAKEEVGYKDIATDIKKYASIVDINKDNYASVYAVDPRYNFAPENWYATDDLQVDKTTWIDYLKANYFVKDLCDRDLFLFVSDQEYLQDIGELQFLPRLQDMNGNGNIIGDYAPNFNGDPFSQRKGGAGGTFACGNYFWRTYTAYDNCNGYKFTPPGGSKIYWDPIYALPYQNKYQIPFNSGVSNFRLNPYSNDDRVLFAGFAATPFDYYVASTNEDENVKKLQNISLSEMRNKYAFGQNQVAKFEPTDLIAVADSFRDEVTASMAEGHAVDVESLWPTLEWQAEDVKYAGDDNKRLFGCEIANALHGVDRKFLNSFWHDTFDNRQQLFLIFVRAEPTSIGGGATGNLSSAQLGGRAVALVWRDPNPLDGDPKSYPTDTMKASDFRKDYKKNKAPHKTRVLFYHQFD